MYGAGFKVASELRGEAAIERLDQFIEEFDQTLETVEQVSQRATDPAVKSTLGRIYGALKAAKDQLVQTILTTQE